MAKAIFDTSRCKGCALCTLVCPKKIVVIDADNINAKGFRPAKVSEMDKCTGCAACATMCPDVVITVER